MSRRYEPAARLIVISLVATFAAAAGTGRIAAEQQGPQDTYRPQLAVPETLQPFLQHIEPGNDAFPAERQAKEIEARLRELQNSLRASPARAASVTDWLLESGLSRRSPAPGRRANFEPRLKRCRKAPDTTSKAACGPLAQRRIVRSRAAAAGRGRARD